MKKKSNYKFPGSAKLQQQLENVESVLAKYKEENGNCKIPLQDILNAVLELKQVKIDAEDPNSIYYHIENERKKDLIKQLEDSFKLLNYQKEKLV